MAKLLWVLVPLSWILFACIAQTENTVSPARLEAVATRGAEVMPFDLERSTHIFKKQNNGGIQQVISNNGDPSQIELIRSHLIAETARFEMGDFHDPEMIHGEGMAGLHQLTSGYQQITIEYTPINNGGQISYSSENPELVAALHLWFEAQLADHGSHAQSN